MISEPFNTILVVFICVVSAIHFSGILAVSKKSPSLIWLKNKSAYLPWILSGVFIFVAITKLLMLMLM